MLYKNKLFKKTTILGLSITFMLSMTTSTTFANTLTYKIVDTNQTTCYDDFAAMSSFPTSSSEYYGQDAQFTNNEPSYTLSNDGKTVYDNVTGLTWQRSPNINNTTPVMADKMSLAEATALPATLNSMAYGGYTDWRLPSVKELYSLILFSGRDPSGYTGTDSTVLTPFIDTGYFIFDYGQLEMEERLIDSQYISSTSFIKNPGYNGCQKQFGVNFADGRIKGYDIALPQNGGDKTFFAQCVRGNTSYGINSFVDNGNKTITDNATGLMWAQDDSGTNMQWKDALVWAKTKNAEKYLGYSDWRLPTAKELNSIVDYNNAPEYNGKPAINTTYFNCTSFINENNETDYPYYWTGTTHAGYVSSTLNNLGTAAAYIPFGRALGYMGGWVNVHGSGAQRSDPKNTSTLSKYDSVTVSGQLGYYHGPQNDAIRGTNYVRLVRTVTTPFSLSAVSSVSNGVLNVAATVKNNNINEQSAYVIIATYSNSAKLINIKSYSALYQVGEEKTINYSYNCGDMSDKYFKVFVLDKTSLQPFSLVYNSNQ